jgi:hypothetical protein
MGTFLGGLLASSSFDLAACFFPLVAAEGQMNTEMLPTATPGPGCGPAPCTGHAPLTAFLGQCTDSTELLLAP